MAVPMQFSYVNMADEIIYMKFGTKISCIDGEMIPYR